MIIWIIFQYFLRNYIYLILTNIKNINIINWKNYYIDNPNILKNQLMIYDFKLGAVCYRNHIESKEDKNESFNLTSDLKELQNFFKK